MKKFLLPLLLLLFLSTGSTGFGDTPKLERAASKIKSVANDLSGNKNLTLPIKKYKTCQALVTDLEKKIFSQYILEPTEGLTAAKDTECTTDPLFLFAEDILKKSSTTPLAPGLKTPVSAASSRPHAGSFSNNALNNLSIINNYDVVSKMIDALHRKQYGSYVRQLGLVNTTLACSSRGSARVLDLLFAEILATSMEGGLDNTAEQEKCVQGTFNAALNTFDQLQFTGFSLVQEVITRDIETTRKLLYPKYPVCEAGIWVYDFTTGKLVQLKDAQACKAGSGLTLAKDMDSTKKSKDTSSKYRYLTGYLDQFADPRRFGSGYCSEYFVSGKKDFTCDVGVTCRNTAGNPNSRHTIAGVDGREANRLNGAAGTSNLSQTISGQGNPTRFGIPIGAAEDFLCGRGIGNGGTDNVGRGAFGEPPMDPPSSLDDLSGDGRGPQSDASRNFFQCQASVLFETKIDPTTSCILSAMNEVRRAEKGQSSPDGGRGPQNPSFVIGGVKDPSCQTSDQKTDHSGWYSEPLSSIARRNPDFARNFTAGLVEAQTDTFKYNLDINGDNLKLFVKVAIAAAQTPVIISCPDDDGTVTNHSIGTQIVQSDSSKSGYKIIVYVDNDRKDDWGSDLAYELKKAFIEIANRMLNNKDTKTDDTKKGDDTKKPAGEDPGIDQEPSAACTSALDRALTTLAQCGTPDRSSQPRSDGRPQGGGGLPGVHPTVVDPDPQGVGVIPPLGTVMEGLMACVDQYGKEVGEHSGSKFGPGGCLSPMTLCNTKDCKTYQSNCSQSGQWQCSFALCREDGACCGSPHTSRGGGLGDTPGEHTSNTIDCGEDKVWNPAKRACNDPNGCGDGWTYNASSGLCEPLAPIPTGGRGPGGPEQPVNNNTIPTGNGDPATLTGCPEGTSLPGGRCGPPH